MMSKYKIPTHLYVVFEKLQIQLWTSTSNQPNHFFVHIPSKWLYPLNIFFKRDLSFWNSTLIENSAVDCSSFQKLDSLKLNCFINGNNALIFYVYYFYFLKIKLNLSIFYNFYKKPHINSIEGLYKNAGWLERETAEMYGINFKNKKDVRKLLTDYSNFENPLLKSYPSEGFFDVFYNFFDDQVVLTNNSVVEL